jgi:hypothetical protein
MVSCRKRLLVNHATYDTLSVWLGQLSSAPRFPPSDPDAADGARTRQAGTTPAPAASGHLTAGGFASRHVADAVTTRAGGIRHLRRTFSHGADGIRGAL